MRRSAAFTAHEKPVAGDVKTSFVGYDHLGWLKCDGRALSTTQFNLLFQVIGYTFGVSGNTFNLPDPTGRVLGSVSATHPAGQSVGTDTHTLTIAEMPAHDHGGTTGNSSTGITVDASGNHNHTYTDAYFAENTGGAPPKVLGTNASTDIDNNFYYRKSDGSYTTNPLDPLAQLATSTAGLHTHSLTDPTHNHTISLQGGGLPHNNLQPTLFFGNTFVYSGIPTYPGFPPNPASAWPFTVGLNPPLI